MTYVSLKTPFGPMMVAATDRSISFVQFADEASTLLPMLRAEYPLAELIPMAQPCHPDKQG